MQKLGNCAFMQTIDSDTLMQINYKSALIQDMIIVLVKVLYAGFDHSFFRQRFDLDQNYINLNVTEHPFRYSEWENSAKN